MLKHQLVAVSALIMTDGFDSHKHITCHIMHLLSVVGQTCSPPLARPSNGQIKCDSTGPPVCTFTCDKGYQLIGETESRCQEDETWSVEEIPICSSNFVICLQELVISNVQAATMFLGVSYRYLYFHNNNILLCAFFLIYPPYSWKPCCYVEN